MKVGDSSGAIASSSSTRASHTTKRHCPRNRAAYLDYLEARCQKPLEAALRPVADVPGSVTEFADVRETREIERAPERLPGNACDQPRPRQPGEHVERPLRVLDVLEHLATDDELGGVPAGVELLNGDRLEFDLHAGDVSPLSRLG